MSIEQGASVRYADADFRQRGQGTVGIVEKVYDSADGERVCLVRWFDPADARKVLLYSAFGSRHLEFTEVLAETEPVL